MASRAPRAVLVAVFAVLGAAAGWFGCAALCDRADLLETRSIAAAAGLAGAALAAFVMPARRIGAWAEGRPTAARVTALLVAAAAVAGGVAVALLTRGETKLAAIACLVGAVPMVPVCRAIVGAVRRAERARGGSIVLSAERRALVRILAVAIAGLTLLAIPAELARSGDVTTRALLPLVALCGGAVVCVLVADLAATIRLDRLIARLATDGAGDADAGLGRVDVGLGDELVSHEAAGAAYRGGGRVVSLVLGNPVRARTALSRALSRSAVAVLFIEAVAVAHGLARERDSAAAYEAWRCETGDRDACHPAAILAERAGMPDLEAAKLHDLACAAGDDESCRSLVLLARRSDDVAASLGR